MGKQSPTHPARHARILLRIAALVLLSAISPQLSPAQTSVPATTIPLILPTAIVYDASGNLYLAETASHVIRKVDPTGHITTIAGTGTQGNSGDNGPATAAQLDSPQGLALASTSLYIADTHNHAIRKLSLTTNIITTIAGTGTQGYSGDNAPATSAHLSLPTALAIDTSGNLLFADSGNHRIRRIDPSGTITTIAGTGTQGYSGDNGPALNAAIDSPSGIALDPSNNLYLADTHNHRIRRIDAITHIITTVTGTGTQSFSGDLSPATAAAVALPHGLTIDTAGNLYLADTGNQRIRRIDAATGIITTVAGTGTQTFSGDGSPAIGAALDTPRTTTLSPQNLLTLADAGNQRIRQLTAAPALSTTIQTIAGLGLTTPGTLSLSAPAVIAYGTGTLTATLASSTPAAGVVTFLDTVSAAPTVIGTATLASDNATLPTTSLFAGTHTVLATWPGDQYHPAAQSPAITLSITPQPLTAIITPITLLYGQPIPTLTGTINGLLPQDAASLTAAFTTSAASLSPAGTYPLTATINGPAAGNYTLSTTPATLTIAPAPSVTTLTIVTPPIGTQPLTTPPGTPIPIAIHVATTTSGTPTGTVTVLDGPTTLLASALTATGHATFTLSSLAAGSHTLTARYSGDRNFTPSTSSTSPITIGTDTTTGTGTSTPDFTLTTTGTTSQTILSGTSATYTFSIQTQGSLASPITLAASGLPNLSTSSFNPVYIPPGASPTTFTLTVATPKTSAQSSSPSTLWTALLLPLTFLAIRPRRRRPFLATLRYRQFLTAATLSAAIALCSGCGDRINTANTSTTTNPIKTYTITVTGTATTPTGAILQHTATISLNLQTTAQPTTN